MTLPIWPIIGGILIGSSAVLLMWLIGRTAGISSIVWNAISTPNSDRIWQVLFVFGLAIGAFLFHELSGRPFPQINNDPQLAIAAGLLVGFGVRLGSGCTSGHGVCGIGRLAPRSLVATSVFMVVAILTVKIVRNTMGA